MTADFQMHCPVSSSNAQSRPSPPFEFGSGAPKMTAVCSPPTSSATAALDAIPGPEGLPDPTLMSRGAVVVPQASGGMGARGGYCQPIVPWLGPAPYIA